MRGPVEFGQSKQQLAEEAVLITHLEQSRAATEVEGEFTAISEGAHGWFWRNRSDVDVTVTVRIRGTYQGVR